MNKNRIRLTESQLHRVIKESVKKILSENDKYIHYIKAIQSRLSDETKESLENYNDMELISTESLLRLFNGGVANSNDLYLEIDDNGLMTLDCQSGMTVISEMECDPNDPKSIARAAIYCINKIPDAY